MASLEHEGCRSRVVLMCGVAGSGKTTYAKLLEAEGYVRLSIDEEIWSRFGQYGVDYAPALYAELSVVVESALRERLASLIQQRRDVVVDFSFWQRARRDEYKQMIETAGGRWRLIYLKVEHGVLRQRLAKRSERFDANAAFRITDDILTTYLDGFEEPQGESEEVLTPPGG